MALADITLAGTMIAFGGVVAKRRQESRFAMTRRQLSTALAALAIACVAAVIGVPGAEAHARYKTSTPGAAEVLTTSPDRIEITFTEPIKNVSGTYDIQVTRDRGSSVTAGGVVVDDTDRTKLSVPLQTNLRSGRYVVNWKNTSDDDGDAIDGAFSFYLNTRPTTVDLANDAQLARVGFEDVTAAAAEGTAGVGTTPAASATNRAGVTRVPATSAAAPAGQPSNNSGGGDGATIRYSVLALVVAAAIVGVGVWQYTNRRGT